MPEDAFVASADDFPILRRGIYANHAALAPWPTAVSEAVHQFSEENSIVGPARYKSWVARERRLKTNLATLVGAASWKDIAVLKNTTEGICVVAEGIDWQRGDNIVIPAGEFPSNRLPWLAQERHGVEIRQIDTRSASDPESALTSAIDNRTRVLSVSAIGWDDGFSFALQTLGNACRKNGTLFFVDAIQRVGMLPIDVEACKIDCLSADAHKWLLGPEGISVFYCNEATRPLLRLRQLGWYMVDYPWAFGEGPLLPSDTARRFEAGSPNSLGQAAFDASVQLLLDAGMDTVADSILSNTAELLDGLQTINSVAISSPLAKDRRSGIVCFKPGNKDCAEVVIKLAEANVTCAVRGDSIRLSLHFYQGQKQVTHLLNAIEMAIA